MCGIAGIMAESSISPLLCAAMCDTLSHRGPDDEGYVLVCNGKVIPLGGKNTDPAAYDGIDTPYRPRDEISSSSIPDCFLVLGHRRLSIVDLSPSAHQPMCYGGRYWIVYNGEIYNYIEVRAELESKGYIFYSQSDTEVILAAYDYWGEGCLPHFNGMWAFVIYDCKSKTMFMARDRFGIKPFYYWISSEGFLAFSSEIKAFTVLPGWKPMMNGQRVYDFLAWNVLDHTDETMFSGVFQLQGGCCVLLSLNDRADIIKLTAGRMPGIRRWYSLTSDKFSGNMEDDAAEHFKYLFEKAVDLRLRADVPVGSCLSGGLDSSSIVCMANKLLRQKGDESKQKTFSACAKIKQFDESDFINAVVQQIGVDAHYTYPELDELITRLDDITWHQDEPFGSTSIYAQWAVFRLASESGVKVMLDGQGADEQLAGYHNYFGPLLGSLARKGHWLELLKECLAIRKIHGYSYRHLVQRMMANLFPSLRLRAAALAGKAANSVGWLDHERLGAILRDPFPEEAVGDDIKAMSLFQLTETNVPMLLHYEDRNSMTHSLESRVPFLDYRLVEFVLGLPDQCKISKGITKRIMREGMRDILPDRIRTRMDKLGFVTPEEAWLKETGTEKFASLLQQAIERSNGIIRPEVLTIFSQMVEKKRPFDFFIWRIISFGAWLNKFTLSITRNPTLST